MRSVWMVGDSETVASIARASRDNFSERYHLISVARGWEGRLPGAPGSDLRHRSKSLEQNVDPM